MTRIFQLRKDQRASSAVSDSDSNLEARTAATGPLRTAYLPPFVLKLLGLKSAT